MDPQPVMPRIKSPEIWVSCSELVPPFGWIERETKGKPLPFWGLDSDFETYPYMHQLIIRTI